MRPALALLLALSSTARAQSAGVEDAFPGLAFRSPLALVAAPGGGDRVYVLEKAGRARTAVLGSGTAGLFLDLSDRVAAGGEGGLLGLAFHPGYAENGRLFVSYTTLVRGALVSRVSEFARSAADPLAADPGSEHVLIEEAQPADNHNGGALAFGPDGLLYVALGDGGGGGDPFGNGQDPTTLLGSVLRIGVDSVPEGAYTIPEGNPFADGVGGRPEVFAYGLRNPWKFSFDTVGGALWLGDVGQGAWEEVDVVRAGGNYGWNQVEGPACFRSGCDLGAFEPPVFAYRHGADTGRSITGGFVYRGARLDSYVGQYLYADFASGRVWALDTTGAEPASTLLVERYDGARANVSALDPGPDGEPYVVDYASGRVFRLVPLGSSANGAPEARPALTLAGPNPFRDGTALEADVPPGRPARVAVYDVLGREVAVLHDGPASGPLRLALDGRALAPGVYTVRLAGGGGGASVRVVRAR